MTAIESAKKAKQSIDYMLSLSSTERNSILEIMSAAIVSHSDEILRANAQDLANLDKSKEKFRDRLLLDNKRIQQMSNALLALVKLPDPLARVESFTRNDGLKITKQAVPFGVVCMIYESRPNVTFDSIGLCVKTGNCVLLRGGTDSYASNKALVEAVKTELTANGYKPDFIQLVSELTHEGVESLLKARGIVDLAIPRGGKNLIDNVVRTATVPVIETGAGNCHAYVHNSAKIDMAIDLIINGKTQRPSVCNALESLLLDSNLTKEQILRINTALLNHGVEIVGCEKCVQIDERVKPATESDYFDEYNSLKISEKIIANVQSAVDWINSHSTHHSEVIIASDKKAIEYFTLHVDSAAVYANSSVRFTDGGEFGMGAEIGISTQKLHARGPMGLNELTTYKYIVTGNGQTRN